MTLTPKQRRFGEEYLVDLNMTAAYKRAGYSACGHSAEVAASRLMSNVELQRFIQENQEKISKKTLVTVEYVVEGLKEVAQRCMQRVPVMVGQGKERKQAKNENGEGVWEFDSSGANRAFELLGKHVGVFSEDAGDEDVTPVKRVEIVIKDGRKP